MHRKTTVARTRGYSCRKASLSCPHMKVGITGKRKIKLNISDDAMDVLAATSWKEKRSINGVIRRAIQAHVRTVDGEYPK